MLHWVTKKYKLKNTVDRLNVPDANGNIEMELH
jgi:hypothetical protein